MTDDRFHIVITVKGCRLCLPGAPGTRDECEQVARRYDTVQIVDGPIPDGDSE